MKLKFNVKQKKMKKKNAENCCFVGDKEVNFFLRSICFETAARLTRKSIIYLIKNI